MSTARANAVSEINLEEFERRLRAVSAPQTHVEDPLAELTRLVDTIAADRPRGDRVVDFSATRLPKAERFEPLSAPLIAPQVVKPVAVKPVEPLIARAPAPEPVAPPVIELRGPVEEPPPAYVEPAPEVEMASEPEPEFAAEEADMSAPPRETRSGRASSWYLKVGGLTALALIMGAGALAWKVGVPGMPKKPPMILAVDTPVKVAPPKETSTQSSTEASGLTPKDTSTTAPVKIVSNEEQPVDLNTRSVATQPKETASASPSPSPSPTLSNASPVAPTADTPIVPLANNESAAPLPAAGAPKRVKTVSVRPDGTLISADAGPAAAAPAPAPTVAPTAKKPDAPAVAPQAATPSVELPAKPAVPKSSARVAIPKTDTTVPADAADANAPLNLAPPAKPDKPAKLPTKLRPPKTDAAAPATAPAADTTVADAAPVAAAPAASGGDWSVQLAAPRSESDAQSAITRLNGKYGDTLGGAALGVHKAEVNGSTIYRVRASGMSKSEAAALCSKLKAAGGDCFVAKN